MSKKPTLTEQVADLASKFDTLLSAVTSNGQFATAGAVAEAVKPVKAITLVKVAAPVQSASDVLKDAVEAQNLAFARGGRTVLTTAHLTAAVRVLKTGTPEILAVENVNLEKRNVTHIAFGRDGDKVITQYVYSPEQ